MAYIKLLKTRRDNVPTVRKGKYQDIYQDKRWKNIVREKKRMNPLCERCESNNKVVPLTEIHHIIPFDWGTTSEEVESLAFDFDNTKSVCSECHNIEHDTLNKNGVKEIWQRNMLIIS